MNTRILAQRTTKCPECQLYIVARRDVIMKLYDGGTIWVHTRCYRLYWNKIDQQMTMEVIDDMGQ